mgnify:CR=1 FL=1
MAKKTDSEFHFRCNSIKKARAKYLCKAKLGTTLSQLFNEFIETIGHTKNSTYRNLSSKQRKEMLSKISN